MNSTKILTMLLFFLLSSCKINTTDSETKDAFNRDSLILVNMVRVRAAAREKNDIITEMSQFSADATFISGSGSYLGSKEEIDSHLNTKKDSSRYFEINLDESKPPTGVKLYKNIKYREVDRRSHYKIGNVKVRILDQNNALVYYPWRIDAYIFSNPQDTIFTETGLMTLSAQKRKGKWFWVAITNQLTEDFFQDLEKH